MFCFLGATFLYNVVMESGKFDIPLLLLSTWIFDIYKQ